MRPEVDALKEAVRGGDGELGLFDIAFCDQTSWTDERMVGQCNP